MTRNVKIDIILMARLLTGCYNYKQYKENDRMVFKSLERESMEQTVKIERVILVLIFGFFLILSGNSFAQTPPEESPKKVEMFVDGKKFDDPQQYRQEQLKEIIKKAYVISSEKDPEIFQKQIDQHLSPSVQQEFSKEEIAQALKSFFDNEQYTVHKNNEKELKEIQQLLDEAKKKFDETEDVQLDPQKVKTIIINPTPTQ